MLEFARMQASTDRGEIEDLLTRGVENVIPRELALRKLSSGEPLRVYFGVDPTGAKLHLGHSVPLRKLSRFASLGHTVIFVVGSFTAMIGDPSGRDTMREPLSAGDVKDNFADYRRQAEKILDFSKTEIRYNDEWLAPLTLTEIVGLASRFTVQQMLKRDMFQRRMGEDKPIGLHEFLYPLMVGYDSAMLDVDAELGGSDQEFNMLAGRHLQQALGKREKFILTTRLIEGLDGRKMSKTYDNCVYLTDSPTDMYGKLMSLRDDLLPAYFETCTDIPLPAISTIMQGHPKEAKMRLAREIVAVYHGFDRAAQTEKDFAAAFQHGGMPGDIREIVIGTGEKISDALIADGTVSSKAELRRLLQAGAVSEVGGAPLADVDAIERRPIVLRIGKHRFVRIT